MSRPLDRLRYRVTGAIERGEADAIAEMPTPEAITARLATWKDDEYGYCRSLVLGGGPTREVPRASVYTYLVVQRLSAERDNRDDVATAIGALMATWKSRGEPC